MTECFENIDQTYAKEIADMEADNIDCMNDKNKGIIKMEKWNEMYRTAEKEVLYKQYTNIVKKLEEITGETANTDDKRDFADSSTNRNEKRKMGVVGFNLDEMGNSVKFVIAFGFFGIIALLFSYALGSLKKKEVKKKKKSQ